MQGTSIGFSAEVKQTLKGQLDLVTPDDLIRFGLIPEFVGRFPVAVGVQALTLEDMTRILLEPKNSLIKQMQWLFESDGVELEFEDTAIIAVAQQALDMKIGARGLKTIRVTSQGAMPANRRQR